MRRFVMICMALMAAVSVRAVDLKTGSFGVLLGQSQVEVVFDFSSVVIDGMTLDDFKSGGRVDEDYENWDDFEVFIKRRFIAGLNRYHAKIPGDIVFRFSGSPCRYTLKVIPAMMNIDGVYSVNFCLTDNDTGETAGTAYGSGDGGRQRADTSDGPERRGRIFYDASDLPAYHPRRSVYRGEYGCSHGNADLR